jgi:hypothetical protein
VSEVRIAERRKINQLALVKKCERNGVYRRDREKKRHFLQNQKNWIIFQNQIYSLFTVVSQSRVA